MNPDNHFDVLVIGGGPAGATAAFILATNGYRVAIIEKKKFPRSKLCGGLLTQKTIELIEDIFATTAVDLESTGAIKYRSQFFGFGDSNGNFLQGKLGFPVHFADREIYDALWLDKAVDAGAKVIFEEIAEDVAVAEGKVFTRTGKKFSGRYIIAADGVFSRLRLLLYQRGLLEGRRKNDIAAALEMFVPRDSIAGLSDYPCIYWGYVSQGYAWTFPGSKFQIFGMCTLKQKARKYLHSSFARFLKDRQIDAKHFSKPKGYALPYGNYLRKAGYKNILLIGDAGGFADPILGEGIYYAHRSAQMAADAVERSRSNPNKAQSLYSQQLNAGVIAEFKYMQMSRRFLLLLPLRWQSKLLAFMLKKIPKELEEAVQGKRSFKLLLPTN